MVTAWTIIGHRIRIRQAAAIKDRMALAAADAYGRPGPATPEQIAEISENWRPYRTWVTLLLRTRQEIPVAGALRLG